jgi:hypothetical protein
MLFHTNLDLLRLKLVCFVLENGNFVLEMSWKIIFPWMIELITKATPKFRPVPELFYFLTVNEIVVFHLGLMLRTLKPNVVTILSQVKIIEHATHNSSRDSCFHHNVDNGG